MTKETIHRFNQLEEESKRISGKWIYEFSDDYRGKLLFAISLLLHVDTFCEITPGFSRDTFADDLKDTVALWIEAGEPL